MPKPKLKVLLNGASGRLGSLIHKLAQDHSVEISAPLTSEDNPADHIQSVDLAIDVSSHLATLPLAKLCQQLKKPLIVGTTGHPDDVIAELQTIANDIPLLLSSNFAIGIHLLNHLAKITASTLSADYHAEIIEYHHANKTDSPSGTAKTLLQTILDARNLSHHEVIYGREGNTGTRPNDEVGVHAIRGGDIIGEHTLLFAGPGERIEITHKATDRSVFASGALSAAHWISQQPPGFYKMNDVLGLKP